MTDTASGRSEELDETATTRVTDDRRADAASTEEGKGVGEGMGVLSVMPASPAADSRLRGPGRRGIAVLQISQYNSCYLVPTGEQRIPVRFDPG